MNDSTDHRQALIDCAIGLGDDALVLGHRLSEWCRNGPFLEEDLALTNVALDFVGRARMLYSYAGEIEGKGRDEDAIAYLRDSREYTNLLINELPIGDFGDTMARQFLVDAFEVEFFSALTGSADATLAAIAAKSLKECRYHLRRSRDWVIRLGDGTEESHRRMQRGLDRVWGFSHELFTMNETEQQLAAAGIAADRGALKSSWDRTVDAVLAEATLTRPDDDWSVQGGRDGVHTEHLGLLLAEMQFMQRAYPGLEW
ncbi:MAG: 1,2-phenylacetyl-CoA epoxidase subunit PaaC [Xanthomonadales bacterium]|nr:1,2-phenylacetyl-CoA epoxidase subunit PaaC [Xanthomonadales bacterium]